MNEFLQRLRQRKMVQWAVAYVAAAFALLQGIDIVAQQFAWPEGVRRGITLAMVIGFFVTLVLAWYHGERGAQRVTGTELLILALLLSLGGGFLWHFAGVSQLKTASILVASSPSASPVPAIPEKSIAVLPLVNASNDKDEQYFSDGLSEDLITALSQFAGLKVIGRNSSFQFRDSKDDSRTIGAKLGVAHLLEGSVRRAADVVRISAELVNAADGTTLWSRHYDRPYKDLFKLQDDITTAVASALKTKLLNVPDSIAQSDRPPSGNLEAYNDYLQGQFYFARDTADGYRKAIASYKEAVALDPRYALAFARLAGAETFLSEYSPATAKQDLADARPAVDRALSLNPDLAAAHGAHALLLAFADLDWVGAKAEFERAVQLAPNDHDAIASHAQMGAALGHPEAAIEPIRRAIAADPLSANWYSLLEDDLIAVGRLDEAEAAARRELTLHASNSALARLSFIDVLRGNAAAALEKAEQIPAGQSHDFALTDARQIGPDRAAADAAVKNLIDRYGKTNAYLIARTYALRKDPDKVFEWLDRAWANRENSVCTLYYDPFLLGYKTDPRFAAFCKKVGLPTPAEVAAEPKT